MNGFSKRIKRGEKGYLRILVTIMRTVWCSKAKGESEQSHIKQRKTIAGQGESQYVAFFVDNKDTHKCHIEDNPLHQHPHEGDKEEVV